MKIIVTRWRAWNQADVEETFARLGFEITPICMTPSGMTEEPSLIEKITALLQQEEPCFLFSINYFPALAESCHQTKIPYVCWNCDGSLLAMYHDSVFYDTNFIFSFDRACVTQFHSLNMSQIWHLPLGVNAERLQRVLPDPRQSSNTKYDISFLGSLYQKNSFDPIAGQLPEYLAGYLEGCLEAQLAVSGGNMLEVLLTPSICAQLEHITDYQRSEHSFAGIRELFSSTVLGFKAASLARQRLLNALAAAGSIWQPGAQVHLFTADEPEGLVSVQIHPPADYFTQMPQIFRNSAININSTVPTIRTGIPLRVWDILGCGGFLLTDYQEELLEHFQQGKHLSIYEDTEELLDKAEFYWKHDELRQKAAQESQKLVLTEHTWDARIQKMLHTLPFL